jgi:hypothetical protein
MIFLGRSSTYAQNIPLDRGKYGILFGEFHMGCIHSAVEFTFPFPDGKAMFHCISRSEGYIALRSVVISSDPNGIINMCQPLRRNAYFDGNHSGRGRPTIWRYLLREVNGSLQLSFPPGRKTYEAVMVLPPSLENKAMEYALCIFLSVEIGLMSDLAE